MHKTCAFLRARKVLIETLLPVGTRCMPAKPQKIFVTCDTHIQPANSLHRAGFRALASGNPRSSQPGIHYLFTML